RRDDAIGSGASGQLMRFTSGSAAGSVSSPVSAGSGVTTTRCGRKELCVSGALLCASSSDDRSVSAAIDIAERRWFCVHATSTSIITSSNTIRAVFMIVQRVRRIGGRLVSGKGGIHRRVTRTNQLLHSFSCSQPTAPRRKDV